MAISGAICSLAGASQILGFTYAISVSSAMDNYGFDGLAVALLASNNPIGVIFSGLFFGSLKYAGSNLQRVLGVPSELINIIIGTIILFTAVPLIFKIIRANRKNRKLKKVGGKKIINSNESKDQISQKPSKKEDKNIEKSKAIDKKALLEDKNQDKTKDGTVLSNKASTSNIINETGEDIIVRTVESEEE